MHIALVGLLVIISLSVQSQEIPQGDRLRDLVTECYVPWNVFVGGTADSAGFTGSVLWKKNQILEREFGTVTPQNDFKHSHIVTDADTSLDFSASEPWVERIAASGQLLRMHAPIGPQVCDWVKEDDTLSSGDLTDDLDRFLNELYQHYGSQDQVRWVDVVNETINPVGWVKSQPGTNLIWEVPHYNIGTLSNGIPEYIDRCFLIAHAAAPGIKKIWNHNQQKVDLDVWGVIQDAITDLESLGDEGYIVDGIGWQHHCDYNWHLLDGEIERLQSLVQWAHHRGKEFHITEFDSYLCDDGLALQEQEQIQADHYASVLQLLLDNRTNGVVGWNTWNVMDIGSNNRYSAMFDGAGDPKPAYYAFQKTLARNRDVKFLIDSFDDRPVGWNPSPDLWVIQNECVTRSVDIADGPWNGDRCICLEDLNWDTSVYVMASAAFQRPIYTPFLVEFSAKFDEPNQQVILMNGQYHWNLFLGTTLGGSISLNNAYELIENDGKWHSYQLAVDPLTDTASVRCDGVMVASGQPFKSATDELSILRFKTGPKEKKSHFYINNVAVYQPVDDANEVLKMDFDMQNAADVSLYDDCADNGSLGAGLSFTSDGVGGYVLKSNGSGSVVVSHSAELAVSKALSISLDVKLDAVLSAFPYGTAALVRKNDWGQFDGYQLVLTDTNADSKPDALRFRIDHGWSFTQVDYSVESLSSGVWYNVQATYDGARLALYIDGEERAATSYVGAIDPTDEEDLIIANNFIGCLDNLVIKNYVE